VVSALLQAATLLHTHGDAADAERLYDQLAEDEPERAPEILAARARMYAEGGDPTRALATLDHGLVEYPDSVELRYARASRYDDMGNGAAALRELNAIARQRPQDPAAMNALGYTLADHSRELPRARALIERAYAAAPKNAAFRDSLGWVLYRQGHAAEALALLSAAYADEHDGDIAAHLGEVLWRLGKTAEAERIWTGASRSEPDNALIKATRLRLHVQ
jgi:predicted Zn-dependent protease